MKKAIIAGTLALAACVTPSSLDAQPNPYCFLNWVAAECQASNPGCFLITWDANVNQCSNDGAKIERRVGSGPWVLLSQYNQANAYQDCPPFGGPATEFTYRVTVSCSGCPGGETPSDSAITDPVTLADCIPPQ